MRLDRIQLFATAFAIVVGAAGAARAQEPFRIGVVEDLNGTYSGNGGPNSVLATRMAVEDFGGTVLGRPIQVIAMDHQTKPDLGVSLARQLIDQNRVSMLNIGGSSGVGLAVQNLAKERKIVSIQSGNYAASITGKACSPYGTQWAVSTTALARGAAGALLRAGAKTWFVIQADYAFGHDLANDVQQTVEAGGGKVIGRTLHPLATTDMSSPLLQAQASRAEMIAFANAGPDLVNSVKQAKEFGIKNTAALLVFINNVLAMGLETAQGLRFPVSFYWDSNEPSRAFAKRFMARNGGTPPGMSHAMSYISTLHYLQAVQQVGKEEPVAVNKAMREMPFTDGMLNNPRIQANGTVAMDIMLVQVKTPAESRYPNDVYKVLDKVPSEQLFPTAAQSGCTELQQ
ncbi:MAG: ABC transporter substrate-binding protein [Gemmatimonadaceae bacterium]|nr:ABC transporter substrate-binding protein [Acetobacteraceae bacterium]